MGWECVSTPHGAEQTLMTALGTRPGARHLWTRVVILIACLYLLFLPLSLLPATWHSRLG